MDHFNEWLNEGDFEIHDLPESLIEACGGIPDYNNQINEVKNENTKNSELKEDPLKYTSANHVHPSSASCMCVKHMCHACVSCMCVV